MCIIIGTNKGVDIPIEHIKTGWIANPDGGGYMFNYKNEVVVKKGFLKLKEFIGSYLEDRKKGKQHFILHMRKVSRGPKNKENCHPFYTHKNKIALAHNGTILSLKENKEKSDTWLLAEMLSRYNETWTDNKQIQILLNDFIGYGKLVVLTPKLLWRYGNFEKENDVFYSNKSYLPEKVKITVITPNNSNNINNNINEPVLLCKYCGIELQYTREKERFVCYSCYQSMKTYSTYEDYGDM